MFLMINYSEKPVTKKILKSEKNTVSLYTNFEMTIKKSLENCIAELKEMSFENEIFKTMLLNNFANAVVQADYNIQNIKSLSNVLDILENQEKVSKLDLDTYNKLDSKIVKDIDRLQNFINQTISSFENVPIKGKKKSVENLNMYKGLLLQNFSITNGSSGTDDKVAIVDDDEVVSLKESQVKSLKKKFDASSSDLLCFFPKKQSDNLVLSTSQQDYKISFNDDIANISIQDENFNISLRTPGVQISNSGNNNILFVSHHDGKYSVITNNQIEIPNFVVVSKIAKRDDFLELEITSDSLHLNIEDSIVNFEQGPSKMLTYNFKQGSVEDDYEDDEDYDDEEKEIVVTKKKTAKSAKSSSTVPAKPAKKKPKPAPEPVEEDEDEDEEEDEDDDTIKDNDILIISDSNKNVILPYKVEDLEKKLKENKKYKTLEDVIENEYTIPLETFKNPTKSRFREAFQLIKKKEKGSLKEAIELGFELMFQSDLNPAVIAACKDLDELDIYLDCLDDNELDKFSCFKIQYDVPPMKKSKSKK